MTLTQYAVTWPTPTGIQYELHDDEQTALAHLDALRLKEAVVFELDLDVDIPTWVRDQFRRAFPWLDLTSLPTPSVSTTEDPS